MSVNIEAAKPKGRKRLTDEERAARAAAAEEKRKLALEKKAAKEAAAQSKRELKAAIDELKRQQEELRKQALIEDRRQRCEMVRQYAAKMKILKERRESAASLRQSTNDLPAGCMRSPPSKDDIIYEETYEEEAKNTSETDEELEDSAESVDWDAIELPVAN